MAFTHQKYIPLKNDKNGVHTKTLWPGLENFKIYKTPNFMPKPYLHSDLFLIFRQHAASSDDSIKG